MEIQLYGFWRSLATFRVRAALNFKALEYTETVVDLAKGEQSGDRSTASMPGMRCLCSSTVDFC